MLGTSREQVDSEALRIYIEDAALEALILDCINVIGREAFKEAYIDYIHGYDDDASLSLGDDLVGELEGVFAFAEELEMEEEARELLLAEAEL